MVSTYQIYLYPEHPIYMIQNGTLMAISQLAYEAATTADETQQTMLRIVRMAMCSTTFRPTSGRPSLQEPP